MVLALSLTAPPPPPQNLSTTTNNKNGNSISNYSLLLLSLSECNNMSQLKQIHAQTLRTTLPHHHHSLFLFSRILNFASSADLDYAYCVFDQIGTPNSFMWNTLIRACAKNVDSKLQAINLYKRMLEEGNVMPDKHTFPFALKACAYLFALL
ncbi:hypothetical protein Patl1_16305 [Pistacia atlantica]|uniref:Uncharacterized protein n=1 Tax=Pistacia atlantica TaxID=434234 RepID=A0ACC1B608_9ROSI|nr:hypothetical protein Patl1_16305 [Pistacia atlantica]